MTTHWKRWIAALVLCGLAASPQTWGDEQEQVQGKKEADKAETVKKIVKVFATSTGKHWLGIHALPIDDAIKAQLGLKDRLIVHHVMPDSPADKAGLKTHDILLKFGDQDIFNLNELVEAVGKAGDQESSILVMRGGKELKLLVKPGDRPADIQEFTPKVDPDELHKLLGKAFHGELNKDGTFTWRALGPGIAPMMRLESKVAQFPEGLSISVSREDDKPAKIVAKKDGKTYETTQDRLDVLPDDIRPFVERLLGGKDKFGIQFEKSGQLKSVMEHLKSDSEAAKALRQHIEVRQGDGSALQELRKDLENLRKEFESLKESKSK